MASSMSSTVTTAPKAQVAKCALLHLHAQIVHYNLHGAGSRFYEPPVGDNNGDNNEFKSSEEAIQSAKRRRLEALGQTIGTRLADLHSDWHTRLELDLDIVKLICKDFWDVTFNKHVDVLRTNHRGLYVLTDNDLSWLSGVHATKNSIGVVDDYVVFPCGLISGALTRLGLQCRVTAELFPHDETVPAAEPTPLNAPSGTAVGTAAGTETVGSGVPPTRRPPSYGFRCSFNVQLIQQQKDHE